MHLGYGNLFAFYYAINLARQLSQYLYSLQNWDAPGGSKKFTNDLGLLYQQISQFVVRL
jgi:hypothetical protein